MDPGRWSIVTIGGQGRLGTCDVQIPFTTLDVPNQVTKDLFLRFNQYTAKAFNFISGAIGSPGGIAPLGDDGLIPPEFIGDQVTPATLHVSASAGGNTAVTATLPAVGGKFHAITSIKLVRVASAAVAGTVALTTTSTNLPGNPTWVSGNAIAAGQQLTDLSYEPALPLRALSAGTATTITMPAAGVNCSNIINISYLLV